MKYCKIIDYKECVEYFEVGSVGTSGALSSFPGFGHRHCESRSGNCVFMCENESESCDSGRGTPGHSSLSCIWWLICTIEQKELTQWAVTRTASRR